MIKHEYEWVKQTRQVLLDQCKTLSEKDLTQAFGFGMQSIRNTLVHVAGCYHAWLGSFVLSETAAPLLTKEAIDKMQVDDIQCYFQQADTYVDAVMEQCSHTFDNIIEKAPAWNIEASVVRKTPHQLLIHSITHEFHHKGQIAAMLRLLGLTPNNTDILGLAGLEITKENV